MKKIIENKVNAVHQELETMPYYKHLKVHTVDSENLEEKEIVCNIRIEDIAVSSRLILSETEHIIHIYILLEPNSYLKDPLGLYKTVNAINIEEEGYGTYMFHANEDSNCDVLAIMYHAYTPDGTLNAEDYVGMYNDLLDRFITKHAETVYKYVNPVDC